MLFLNRFFYMNFNYIEAALEKLMFTSRWIMTSLFFGLLVFLLSFASLNLYAEIDKTLYSNEEILKKIENLNWQYSSENPIIEDNDANAYIDLRKFPFVEYLKNYDQVVQFEYWITGTESPETKFVLLLYPSEEESNYDYLTVYVDKYDNQGYLDGSDWVDVDPDKILSDQWKTEEKENKKKIENGYDPVTGLEWYIKPTFNKDKGYVYQTLKFFQENEDPTYNTWIYILGRDGYQFLNLAFGEDDVKYVNENLINKILDSFIFQEGRSYSDFQEGDKVSSNTAADLVTTKEPELNLYLSVETLCVDVINTVSKTNLSENDKSKIFGVVSGFNLYDFYTEGQLGYSSSKEDLLNEVSSYCLANPNESFILAITNVIFSNFQ